ncbi:uncharacterized protein PRCAT00000802001 [Priceomyces carsonii]|uniref:uncharacterized protein n=1 Tax=Priceomyces carsonii TaxID=28549 RepID=UPI002ED7B975|nr:unnamed protein product [Priceomyces carsonii]
MMGRSLSYVFERLFVLVLVVNTVYLASCYVHFSENGIVFKDNLKGEVQLVNVDMDANNPLAESGTNSIDYSKEIDELLKDVKKNKERYWMVDTKLKDTKLTINPYLFLNESKDENAWVNQNTLFYDPRLTLSLYLNYIRTEYKKGNLLEDIEVPFNWADWVDLTLLNDELSRPMKRRKDCDWFKKFTLVNQNVPASRLNCISNKDITPKLLNSLGFSRHEQLPGFISVDYSPFFSFHKVRLMHAKTYTYTVLPNPKGLIFLNKKGGTFEVNIEKGDSKRSIIKSGMVREYMKNKLEGHNAVKNLKETLFGHKMVVDPVKEFRQLVKDVKPTVLEQSNDPAKMYQVLHAKNASKELHLTRDMFRYTKDNIREQILKIEELQDKRQLTTYEEGYLDSLYLSKEANTNTEVTYFKQAVLEVRRDKLNTKRDHGYHYDWRFFNGALSYPRAGWNDQELVLRTNIILDRLLRTWFRFAEEKGLVSWIMHGPLLSWFWNGSMFPFDDDIDIQMPISELARLGKLYNQTLVIEDIEEGYGKYLVDVGTYIHNRDISKKANHIDARFIDVDTGMYIDITGLGVSDAEVPLNYYKDGIISRPEGEQKVETFNDRRKHWYTFDQILPLKYTMISGIPTFVPNDIPRRLTFEYPDGISRPEYSNWHFIPKLNMWLQESQLLSAFDENDFRKFYKDVPLGVDKQKLMKLILEVTDEQVYKLLKSDDAILSEYYLTKQLTELHNIESAYLFNAKNEDGSLHYESNEKLLKDPAFKAKYDRFVEDNVKIHKPIRKSLFQFEKIERPLHHKR